MACLAAPFILCNSMAGLAGLRWSDATWPEGLPWLVVAVIVGGFVGTRLGTQRLPARALVALLSVVLLVASLKLLATS